MNNASREITLIFTVVSTCKKYAELIGKNQQTYKHFVPVEKYR